MVKKKEPDVSVQDQLRALFKGLKNKVRLVLFTDAAKKEPYNQAAEEILQIFKEAASVFTVETRDLKDDLARSYNINASPTILLDPDKYNIRWLGAPLHEESRGFIEGLVMAGMGRADLSEDSTKILDAIDEKRHLTIFTSPT
ncbi:MAG: hypothetical protein SWH61_17165 [Thermodesulfobacteriota bacterium]|nr:hypothetical protein [Thermodesulfobacteriota bacterium]